MADNSPLPRVELTLANEDDADCDNCDNGLDQEGGIELVDANVYCHKYDYVVIKCQPHHQRFPIPKLCSAPISMRMKMYIKRHHHWGVDVTLSCTRNMWHVATKCQICPFAFSKLDSTAFT